jgi:hypothetical protein
MVRFVKVLPCYAFRSERVQTLTIGKLANGCSGLLKHLQFCSVVDTGAQFTARPQAMSQQQRGISFKP